MLYTLASPPAVVDNQAVTLHSVSSSVHCLLTASLLAVCGISVAAAQTPTASQRLHASAFALANGTLTGLEANQTTSFRGGKNIAFTLGGDLGFYSPGAYSLALELRGTYPLASGHIVDEKSVAAGLQVAHEPPSEGFFRYTRPYVDVLFGRGQLTYQAGGYLTQNFIYFQSNSNLLQGGGGVEIDVTQHFSLKVDAQVQRWKTPVLPEKSLYSKVGGIGVAYRFGAGSGPR